MEATRLNMFVFFSLVAAAMLHGSSAQTTHVVGDALGWLVPPGGDAAYRTWAATQTFTVGDVLVFNFSANEHNVAEVSKEAFDSCNTTNPISLSTTSPTNITLASAGEHHFLCTFPSHCAFGQKLAINVTAAPAPQPATPPPPETAPSPAVPAPEVYTVGDALGWLVPPGGPIAYQTWARGKTFVVGDILVFNFTNASHNVLQVTRAEFDSCNVSTTTTPPTTASPARITLTSAGEHYYMCTFPQHCTLGQKLAINVTGGSGAPAPAPSSPAPTPSSPPTPPPSSATPPPSAGGPSSSTPSTPSPLTPPPPPSSATPPPSAGGPSSSTPSTPSPLTPPPPPSSATPPPSAGGPSSSTPSTPSPLTPPPPPSGSSASVAVAALPFTFLAVALAFLCN